MTILVELNPDAGARAGDWIVRNGSGGSILSTHRLKRVAKKEARKEARKRDTGVKVQNTNGVWKQL